MSSEQSLRIRPGACEEGRRRARLESGDEVSSWFAWAQVAPERIAEVAAAGGFEVEVVRRLGRRWFARLIGSPGG